MLSESLLSLLYLIEYCAWLMSPSPLLSASSDSTLTLQEQLRAILNAMLLPVAILIPYYALRDAGAPVLLAALLSVFLAIAATHMTTQHLTEFQLAVILAIIFGVIRIAEGAFCGRCLAQVLLSAGCEPKQMFWVSIGFLLAVALGSAVLSVVLAEHWVMAIRLVVVFIILAVSVIELRYFLQSQLPSGDHPVTMVCVSCALFMALCVDCTAGSVVLSAALGLSFPVAMVAGMCAAAQHS